MSAPWMGYACASELSQVGAYYGWNDGRLGQAYDLIDSVMRTHADNAELALTIKAVRNLVERADVEIHDSTKAGAA